ncbi:hypothetical protein [Beijerinckia sp. L45]|uniref:hypothetical protein n=1 Tax=Beijerinckia sp. L45 TaxID=1641855 RepID=UPI00131C80C7|nr:hypothetical protein [Beijerinckia sp. L45]
MTGAEAETLLDYIVDQVATGMMSEAEARTVRLSIIESLVLPPHPAFTTQDDDAASDLYADIDTIRLRDANVRLADGRIWRLQE